MSRKRLVAAIELGTNKFCSVVAASDGKNEEEEELQILGVGVARAQGLSKGMVVNIDDAARAIRESVKKAELQSGFKIHAAYVGITGTHIASSNSRSVVSIGAGGRKVSRGDVKRALTSVKNQELPEGRKVLHLIPKEFLLDTNASVKKPLGMKGYRLDLDAHIITGAQTCLTNMEEALHRAGVHATGYIPGALASAYAVLTTPELENGALLIDIGGSTTDVALFQRNSVQHISVLPVGGNNLSSDLSIALGLPLDMAEKVKLTYGDLLYQRTNSPSYAKKQEQGGEEAVDTDTINLGGGRILSRNHINEILRCRVVEILNMAMAQIAEDSGDEKPYTTIVITGGTANLRGTEWVAEAMSGLPARVGIPGGVYGLTDGVQEPAYACPVGLLHWSARKPETPIVGNGDSANGAFSHVRDLARRTMDLVR